MDIFTTQLANVLQTPIKPSRLKVKSLVKETKARALNEENDHIYGETDNYVENAHLHKNKQQAKDDGLKDGSEKATSTVEESMSPVDDNPESSTVELAEQDSDDTDPTYHKRPLQKDKGKANDTLNDEEKPPHLDLFV